MSPAQCRCRFNTHFWLLQPRLRYFYITQRRGDPIETPDLVIKKCLNFIFGLFFNPAGAAVVSVMAHH